jgi:hypothetical protein
MLEIIALDLLAVVDGPYGRETRQRSLGLLVRLLRIACAVDAVAETVVVTATIG